MKKIIFVAILLIALAVVGADKRDKYSKKANADDSETYNSDFRYALIAAYISKFA
jgi:hypothetical protein